MSELYSDRSALHQIDQEIQQISASRDTMPGWRLQLENARDTLTALQNRSEPISGRVVLVRQADRPLADALSQVLTGQGIWALDREGKLLRWQDYSVGRIPAKIPGVDLLLTEERAEHTVEHDERHWKVAVRFQ